jgi:hypothetical protein
LERGITIRVLHYSCASLVREEAPTPLRELRLMVVWKAGFDYVASERAPVYYYLTEGLAAEGMLTAVV